MKRSSVCRKPFLALQALLIAIFACAALLEAQTPAAPASGVQTALALPDDPTVSESAAANPAFLARANDALLRARKLIDKFFEQTANVVCNEDVAQTMVGKNGKPMYREESVFEYQLQSSSRGGSLKLVESREAQKEAFRDPSKTLLITNGFSSLLLVLHQNFEP